MPIAWNFEAVESDGYSLLPVGDYRIRIAKVEEKKTSTGKDAINVTFDISGKNNKLFYFLVFDPNHKDITNQKITRLVDSFGIDRGNLNFPTWVGKVGGCKVKHQHNDYKNEDEAVIHFFLDKNQQKALPAWVEGSGTTQTSSGSGLVVEELPDIDIQF